MEDDQIQTVVKVTNTKLNVCTHWNLAKFDEKLMQMRDLYQVIECVSKQNKWLFIKTDFLYDLLKATTN